MILCIRIDVWYFIANINAVRVAHDVFCVLRCSICSQLSRPNRTHALDVGACALASAQKSNSAIYQAFSSPSYPELAKLGVEVDWNVSALLQEQHSYQPRFDLDSRVIRCVRIKAMAASYAMQL